MSVHLSPLIAGQLRTLLVMMAAGIFVESLWQGRCLLLQRLRRPSAGESEAVNSPGKFPGRHSRQSPVKFPGRYSRQSPAIRTLARSPRLYRTVIDIHFWIAAAFTLSTFLYYCTWGRLSVHAGLGFLAGLLLWKKMCCAIIRT